MHLIAFDLVFHCVSGLLGTGDPVFEAAVRTVDNDAYYQSIFSAGWDNFVLCHSLVTARVHLWSLCASSCHRNIG
jgi:hypothetical protein